MTLALSANDPGGAVVSMSFSTDGRYWSPDESYQTTRAYTLPAGDGTKTVYARFRDRAGLYSDPASDSIILDTRPPSISNVAVNQMGPDTVEISWRTDEPAFGAVRYGAAIRSYNERGAEDRSGLPQQDGGYGTEHRVRLTRLYPGRTYYASIEAIDRAENRSESPEFQFTAGGPVPTPSVGPTPGLPTPAPGVNVALSANGGRASGTRSGRPLVGSNPSAAIDGNQSTYWASGQEHGRNLCTQQLGQFGMAGGVQAGMPPCHIGDHVGLFGRVLGRISEWRQVDQGF